MKNPLLSIGREKKRHIHKYLISASIPVFLLLLIVPAHQASSAVSLKIISGRHLELNTLTKKEIDRGYAYLYEATTLGVTSPDQSWKLKVGVVPLGENSNHEQEASAVEVRGSEKSEWHPGGGIVLKGTPTDGKWDITLDFRVNLSKVGRLDLEEAHFQITYKLTTE